MNEPRRFVILTHDHPVLHWDLMLDVGDVLRTWRLTEPPQSGVEIAAVALPDHRLMYLDYEGPLSGGRGSVARWDAGTYSELHESTECVTAAVVGEQIRGTISLKPALPRDAWVFVWEP